MAYQPTNIIFLSYQISQQYFQSWTYKPNEPKPTGRLSVKVEVGARAAPVVKGNEGERTEER